MGVMFGDIPYVLWNILALELEELRILMFNFKKLLGNNIQTNGQTDKRTCGQRQVLYGYYV